jgi:hypothetical protein
MTAASRRSSAARDCVRSQKLEEVRARYEPLPGDPGDNGRLVLDAVNPLDDNVAAALAFTRL